MKYFVSILLALLPFGVFAQQMNKEEQDKKLFELVQKEVDRLTVSLDLEVWQVFYTDSILTHNYQALSDELMSLSDAKVSNSDIYVQVQDKWMEENYNALHRILSDDQWKKYEKTGAAREKRARDKRAAKRK